jgi:hypothetical protein
MTRQESRFFHASFSEGFFFLAALFFFGDILSLSMFV